MWRKQDELKLTDQERLDWASSMLGALANYCPRDAWSKAVAYSAEVVLEKRNYEQPN